jgi:uncharacterized protein
MPRVRPPTVSFDDQMFWDGVGQGRLLMPKCSHCGRLQHPPSPMCPNCGSLEWDAQEMSGRGTVHSWIVSQHPTDPDDQPRIVALVALDEGMRLVSNLAEVQPADVTNDMPVEVAFMDVDGVRLAQFRPRRAAEVDRG